MTEQGGAGSAAPMALAHEAPPPRPLTALLLVAAPLALAGAVLYFALDERRLAGTGLVVALLGVALAVHAALEEHRRRVAAADLAQAQRVLQRMWTLGQQLNAELQPGRVLQRFVEAVMDVVRADGGALALLGDDGSGSVRVAAASGVAEPWIGRTIHLGGTEVGRAMRLGVPWTDAHLTRHPERAGLSLADGPLPRGVAAVPLQRRGETIGVVIVGSIAARRFAAGEVARVAAMTDMLAVALANAELVENLRQAEWRFRTLFRGAPDAVLTVFQSGRIREVNDALRELTALDASQLVGRTFADLLAEEDRPRLEQALAEAFAGQPSRFEVRLPRGGVARLLALALSRVPEADPPAALIIARDVTAERDMRARLMESERLAAIGELVAGVAHEVNNPLSSISAFAQLLLRDAALTPEQAEAVEVIKSEAFRASHVVKDLLAFARRSEPQREPLDVSRTVERSLRLRAFQLQTARVRLESSLPAGLPAVVGDARQLQQVVLNLVTNAIQAMQERGGGTLQVSTRDDDGHVVLTVADTGPGIDPSVRARIFEPFVTTKPVGEGTGLGLSVSYGIVAAHGGTIEVAGSSAAGTTFLVRLPAQPAATAVPAIEPLAATRRSPLAGIRLLFVDDEPALRSGMEAFGRQRGFAVVTASDGTAGLAAARETGFDAIVCDLRMPGMDGVAFHDALRRELPGLASRVVFMTGDVLAVSARPASPASRQPVLAKPFTFERLEETVGAVVRGETSGVWPRFPGH